MKFPETLVFQGYAAPVRAELDVADLTVIGEIPAELDGYFVRNSADHAYPPMYENDLFLNGDGMIHQVRIKNGRAHLKTRYVQTEKVMLERQAGRALFGAYRNMYTDSPEVAGRNRNTANTSLVWHGGKLLALKEAARPVELDPETLATIGTHDFGGKLTSDTFTAHPKLDPASGEMIAFGYFTKTVADTTIEVYFVAPDGNLARTETIEAPYPSMVHDCLLSKNYVIFVICPMICDWERVKAGEPFFHWDDRHATWIGIMPREAGGAAHTRWIKAPRTAMQTHTFNAWEDGGLLHLDQFLTETGWLSQFPDINNSAAIEKPPFAFRWTIDLGDADAAVKEQQLFPQIGEMPMIDLRFATSKTDHFWFGTNNPKLGPMLPWGPKGPPFTCLGHFDAKSGAIEFYYSGPDSSPEEPCFIPRPGSTEEGDGWLASVVGRRAENRTDLVLLDARNLSAGPVAVIQMPVRIHEGFHGIWVNTP